MLGICKVLSVPMMGNFHQRSAPPGVGNLSIIIFFLSFMIGLVLPLPLATPANKFSLGRKRRSRKRNRSAAFRPSHGFSQLLT